MVNLWETFISIESFKKKEQRCCSNTNASYNTYTCIFIFHVHHHDTSQSVNDDDPIMMLMWWVYTLLPIIMSKHNITFSDKYADEDICKYTILITHTFHRFITSIFTTFTSLKTGAALIVDSIASTSACFGFLATFYFFPWMMMSISTRFL